MLARHSSWKLLHGFHSLDINDQLLPLSWIALILHNETHHALQNNQILHHKQYQTLDEKNWIAMSIHLCVQESTQLPELNYATPWSLH